MSQGDVALACMTAFVDGLAACGVRDACVSPGARSTPLALSLARHPAVRLHVHLDERSSGFFALGLAKATRAPVAVACTSGTAAANLYPSVVEAAMARVPLVVLTADRPPEFRGVGANQTIDQVDLYGRYPRAFVDAPVPGDAPAAGEWRARGSDAVSRSTTRPPGPVHVNLPFREPLVPDTEEPASGDAPATPAAEPGAASIANADLRPLADEVAAAERGLVYAGGLRLGGQDVVAIARAIQWPLVAEPQSGARRPGSLAGGRLLIESDRFVDEHVPDVVLQIGAAPTSRRALRLIGRTPRVLIVDPDDVVADPLRRASRRVVADPAAVRSALAETSARADEGWRYEWQEASRRTRWAVDALLDSWDEPFEGRVARDVGGAAAPGSNVCVGSSLPVRDLDLFMQPRDDVRVLANRGASGIDGFVSTTLGVAAAGARTVGLLGDLTLLHDLGALAWNARRRVDAAIVVLHNGGGAIFGLLEQRALPEIELFTTPHGVDLGGIVRAAGAGHTVVERASALIPALGDGRETGGIHVIEVRIDAERDRRRRSEVSAAIDEAVR